MNSRTMVRSAITLLSLSLLLVVSGFAADGKVNSIAGLFAVVDPDKDCEFSLLGDNLVMTVPPSNHNLHPTRGMNAPRVLKKVSGDFTVQVKVSSDFKPGAKSTITDGAPFNSAGILIWESEKNYVRVERDAFWSGKQLTCYPPLIEYWQNGAYSGVNDALISADFFKGTSTWFKARRQGPKVTVFMSDDGEEWKELKTLKIAMSDDVSVGVVALNTSDAPFSVQFEEFTIELNK